LLLFVSILSSKVSNEGANVTYHGKQITSNNITKWFTDWSPDGKWIAYSQLGDIWIISTETQDAVNLTRDIEGNCILPCFTNDSKEVTFSNHGLSNLYADEWMIESIHIDTMEHRIIVTGATNGLWSHNGRYIAYSTNDVSDANLKVYDVKNGNTTTIIQKDYQWGVSCFNLDDSCIITSMFVSALQKLFKVPLDGGENQQLTFHEGHHWYPDYSPNGEWILFTSFDDLYKKRKIQVFNPSSRELKPVFPELKSNHWCGSFSSDGSKICYLLEINDIYELFISDFPLVNK